LAKSGVEKKTDTQRKNDVMDELRWEPTVTSTDITVDADGGAVTLSGTVPHYAEKWAAERATQRVKGVKAIAQGREVNLTGIQKRIDTEIAQ
jgi:osmotically-inducible protein OsmY